MGVAGSQILPATPCCISCSTSLLLTLMFDIYSHLDTWYVIKKGLDHEGCGRSPDSPCSTLLYLLQQVNWTRLPPDKELHNITDKSLQIDQRAAVSTDLAGLNEYLSSCRNNPSVYFSIEISLSNVEIE